MDTKDSADLEGTGLSERKGGGAGVCSMVSRVSILRGGGSTFRTKLMLGKQQFGEWAGEGSESPFGDTSVEIPAEPLGWKYELSLGERLLSKIPTEVISG